MIYPVGSIYMNYASTSSPNDLLDWPTESGYTSTWVAISSSKVLAAYGSGVTGFSSLGTSGGYSTVQPHNHQWYVHNGSDSYYKRFQTEDGSSDSHQTSYSSTGDAQKIYQSDDTNNLFTSKTISSTTTNGNYPPYITVAMWRRTA